MIYVRPISSVTNWSFRQILRCLQTNDEGEVNVEPLKSFEQLTLLSVTG